MPAALQDAQAREAFRQQYSDFTRSRALELTQDQRLADALAGRALSTLEERYAHRPLPADPQLAILAQLNIAYAQADFSAPPAAASPEAAPLAPARVLEPLGAPAPLEPQLRPLAKPVYSMANMTEADLERMYTANAPARRTSRRAAPHDTAPQGRVSRRTARNAALYETAAEPAQPAAAAQPVQPIVFAPIAPVVPAAPITPAAPIAPPAPAAPAPATPLLVSLPTVPPAPTIAPVEAVSPPEPAQPAKVETQAPAPAPSAPKVETDAVGVPVVKDVVYDPGQTILWQAGSSFSPAQVIETVHEQQEQQEPEPDPNARSVPMTIINTILLLLCVGAAVFLILQLFPDLFSGLLQ
ncbi:MAG: hypothetical protein PHY12_14815 [Eubacteriales bacterium]|nr:hypothetical protein [Eubacteriales bacterium]